MVFVTREDRVFQPPDKHPEASKASYPNHKRKRRDSLRHKSNHQPQQEAGDSVFDRDLVLK